MNAEQRRQVENATASWNNANGRNGSGVFFVPGPPPAGASNPSTLRFQNGPASGSIAETVSTPAQVTGSGNRTAATITFNNGRLNETQNSMYQRAALHELGHTMGLAESPSNNTPLTAASNLAHPS